MRLGPPPQDHDFGARRQACFIFFLVGGVKIRGGGLELGRTSVHQFVNRSQAGAPAVLPDGVFIAAGQMGQLDIGKPVDLGFFQQTILDGALVPGDFTLQVHDLTDLIDEPVIDTGQFVNGLD